VREPALLCCGGLAWAGTDLLAALVEDFEGTGDRLQRYDADGHLVRRIDGSPWPKRVAVAVDGTVYLLGGSSLERLDADGRRAGRVYVPRDPDLDLRDVDVERDGTLWLVDNRRLEVHHTEPSGDHIDAWHVVHALRHPGDGAYRIAVSRDGEEVYVLTWTRILRYGADGQPRLAWGATGLDPGPFEAPLDIDVDALGRVYLLEGTGRVQVFDREARRLASWMAFERTREVPALTTALPIALSQRPMPTRERPDEPVLTGALAVADDGRVAVADSQAGAIHVFAALGEPQAVAAGVHRPQSGTSGGR
jgi:streptogramin lyase